MAERGKPAILRGKWDAAGLHFGIVVSEFNSFITDRLLAGALDALSRSGAEEKQIEILRVPGSLEIPIAAKKLAATGRCDSIICIGCVIRGETSHYDYVAGETSRGIQLAQLDSGVPMMFCVLTCDTLEQAIDRAGLEKRQQGFRGRDGGGRDGPSIAAAFQKIGQPSPRRPVRDDPPA